MATKTVLSLVALTATLAIGAGCGGGNGGHAGERLAPDVAAGLAARAEQVAAALDAGQCDQALAGARSLQADIAALPVAPTVRAEALAGAARLTGGINCPPPPVVAPPTTQPVAVPQIQNPPKPKEKKGHGHDD
jgi:hypothetical protein